MPIHAVTVFLYTVAQLRLLSCVSEHVSGVPNVTRWTIGSKYTRFSTRHTHARVVSACIQRKERGREGEREREKVGERETERERVSESERERERHHVSTLDRTLSETVR